MRRTKPQKDAMLLVVGIPAKIWQDDAPLGSLLHQAVVLKQAPVRALYSPRDWETLQVYERGKRLAKRVRS